jgi:hypothetical protein
MKNRCIIGLSLCGLSIELNLLATRSRDYEGRRNLKRGLNVHGKVANDCELFRCIVFLKANSRMVQFIVCLLSVSVFLFMTVSFSLCAYVLPFVTVHYVIRDVVLTRVCSVRVFK